MTQSVELAIANLQTKSLAVSGMKEAPSVAVATANQYPFSLAYEEEGEFLLQSVGFAFDLVTIIVEHHVANQVLPKAIALAASLRDPFLRAIRDDPTLGNTVNEVRFIRRRFGRLEFGSIQTIGYQYRIGIKLTLT